MTGLGRVRGAAGERWVSVPPPAARYGGGTPVRQASAGGRPRCEMRLRARPHSYRQSGWSARKISVNSKLTANLGGPADHRSDRHSRAELGPHEIRAVALAPRS
jgi:hypothetical protein